MYGRHKRRPFSIKKGFFEKNIFETQFLKFQRLPENLLPPCLRVREPFTESRRLIEVL